MRENDGLDLVSIRLVTDTKIGTGIRVTSPADAVQVATDLIQDMDREFLTLINMKTDGTPVNCGIVSVGTLDSSLVNVRELMKTSILSNSAAIILLHNHPGGSLRPSKEDIQITNKIQIACELMDIAFYDHLIVGGTHGNLYSMREQKRIEPANLSYTKDIQGLHFDRLLMVDETDYQEKTVTNIIDNYFLTPDRSGVTYKDRLMEGYEVMQSIVTDLEKASGADSILSCKLREAADKEGILEDPLAVAERNQITRHFGKSR